MSKPLIPLFFIHLFLYNQLVIAQDNNEIKLGVNVQNPKNWDTTYYKSYSNKLNIYFGYSRLNYNLDIQSSFKHPYKYSTSISYSTYTPLNYSAGFSYDKISAGFGFSKKYQYDSTQSIPKFEYTAFSFSFGGNKFVIEPYYVRFKGFYDTNTPHNDTTFETHHRYYANPSLEIRSFKLNAIWFLKNKKFAYRSLSGITYRQLKSVGTWFLIGSVYSTNVYSDSTFYPKTVELAYDSVEKLNAFKVQGINVGGGYGHIFAFGKKKRFFIGFTLGLMFGPQKRYLILKDSININEIKGSMGFDARVATGWVTDRFFVIAFASADRVYVDYLKVEYTPYTVPVSISIGWRFNITPPKLYRKFMETKIYGWL